MSFIIIPRGVGCVTHKNIDVDKINLPNDAEVYDDRDAFKDRLSDFDQ
jgi:hypothetical protein